MPGVPEYAMLLNVADCALEYGINVAPGVSGKNIGGFKLSLKKTIFPFQASVIWVFYA